MKVAKVLRRLSKIQALMSDVMERYVTLAPAVRKALREAMAAVTVAKEAVSLEVSSGATRNPPLKKSQTAPTSRLELPDGKRKQSATGNRKAAAKKGAPIPKTARAKEEVPVRAAVKRVATKKAVPPHDEVKTQGTVE
jgi:hypothetical protein